MINNFEVSKYESVEPDYQLSDFIQELHNLNMVRLDMTISESSRYIIDDIRSIEHAVANDISAIEYFQADLEEIE